MANHVESATSIRGHSSTSAAFNLPSSASSSSSAAGDNYDRGYSDDDNDGGDDDDTPLPFPAALPRSDFLATDFQPAAYLSALPHRHQTLEDLRGDLRERSAAISSELLELVNSNYTAFLSLGSELRGGDEKVEGVRVALLGFRRAVEEVKSRVAARREATDALNRELRDVKASIGQGRKMLEISDRLSSLEERLALDSTPASGAEGDRCWDVEGSDDDENDSDNDNDGIEGGRDENGKGLLGSSPARLSLSARECSHVAAILATLDQNHPFVLKLEERWTRCRNTLLLDLGNAMKEAKSAGPKGSDRILKYLGVYRLIEAQGEAVKVLRNK